MRARAATSLVALLLVVVAGCGNGGDCPSLSVGMQSLAAQASSIDLAIFDGASTSCAGNDVAQGAPAPLVTRTLGGHDGTMLQLPAGHYIVVMHAFDAGGAFIGSACEAEVFTPGQRACVSVALSTPTIDSDGGAPDLAFGGGGGGGGGSSVADMAAASFVAQTSGVTTDLYQPWSPGGGVVYVVGVTGVILKTTDSGATWTKQTSGTTQDLEAVWGTSATDVWVAGKRGVVLHTTNGGTSWPSVSLSTTNDVYDVWGAGAGDVYFVGGSGMVKHYNGTAISSVSTPAGMTILNCVWGASGSDVYLFGANGLGLRGSAAAGFNKLASPTSDVLFYGWGSPGAADLWVPSNNAPTFNSARLWHSSDHGATWQAQITTVVLGAAWASATGHAFVVGNEVLETTDGGAHWNSVAGSPAALFGVGGDANGTAVWAVGAAGTILYRP